MYQVRGRIAKRLKVEGRAALVVKSNYCYTDSIRLSVVRSIKAPNSSVEWAARMAKEEAFMFDENDETSGFKVVDRRSFTDDGRPRQEAHDEERGQEPAIIPPQSGAEEDQLFPEDSEQEVPSGFNTLVSYLSTTAMFQLGLLAGPAGERIPADLMNARMTIDLLEVLQEKTEGNLTSDEAKMLDEVLYELRMSFVEVQKRATPKTK